MRWFSLIATLALMGCSSTGDADDTTDGDADTDADADADTDADTDTDFAEPGDPVEPIDTYVFDWGSDGPPDTGFEPDSDSGTTPVIPPALTACVALPPAFTYFTDTGLFENLDTGFDGGEGGNKSLPTGDGEQDWNWEGYEGPDIYRRFEITACADPGVGMEGYLSVGLANPDGEFLCAFSAPILTGTPNSTCPDCDFAYDVAFDSAVAGGEWEKCLNLLGDNPTNTDEITSFGFSTDPVELYVLQDFFFGESQWEPWNAPSVANPQLSVELHQSGIFAVDLSTETLFTVNYK